MSVDFERTAWDKEIDDWTEQWQNTTVGPYLEAMAAWLEAWKGRDATVMAEIERESPTWRGVAQMLHAAKYYE